MAIPNADLSNIFAPYGATGIANNTNYYSSYFDQINLYQTTGISATMYTTSDNIAIIIQNNNTTYNGTITFTNNITADILMIGGGGAGASNHYYGTEVFPGSGGGGGNIVYTSNYPLIKDQTYNITIGSGGLGAWENYTSGSNTTLTYSTTTISSAYGGTCGDVNALTSFAGGNGGGQSITGSGGGGGGGGCGFSNGSQVVPGGSGGDNSGTAGSNSTTSNYNYYAGAGGASNSDVGGSSTYYVDNKILNGTYTLYLGGGGGGGRVTNSDGLPGLGGYAGAGTGGSTNYNNGGFPTSATSGIVGNNIYFGGGGGGAGVFNYVQINGGNGGNGGIVFLFKKSDFITDLKYIYAPYTSGIYALPTNLYTTLGVTAGPAFDLCTIFAPYASGIPSTNSSYAVNDWFTTGLEYNVYTYLDTSVTPNMMYYGIFFDAGSDGAITFNKTITGASILVVGGGGAGGSNQYYTTILYAGSGGGGGGITYLTSQTINAGSSYNIIVGVGGALSITPTSSTFGTYTSEAGTSCNQTLGNTQEAGDGGNGVSAGGGGGGAGSYPGTVGGTGGTGSEDGAAGSNFSGNRGGAGGASGSSYNALNVLGNQMTLYLGGGGGGGSGFGAPFSYSGFAGHGVGGANDYLTFPYAGQSSTSRIDVVSPNTYNGYFGNGGGGNNYQSGTVPTGGNGTVAIFFSQSVSKTI